VPAYLDGTQRGEPLQPELGMPETKAKEVKDDFVAGENGLKKAEEKKSKGKGKGKEKIEGPKVTEEGNLAPGSAKHKFADKDAMARVAEIPADGPTPVVEEQEEEDK
jgi:hypothetical protein